MGVTADKVVAGAGSDDILDILLRVVNPKTIITAVPTFGMYSFLGKISQARTIEIQRDEHFEIDIQKMIETIQKEHVQLVFLASPNNPTGNILPNDQIEALCK